MRYNLVAARQALYTSKGSVYGIEHALTPVVLYYRADVWEGAGFDPQAFVTWDDFVDAVRVIVAENPDVIPLHIHRGLHELLLRQQGHDYFNAEGEVTIDSEESIALMDWLLALKDEGVAGEPPEQAASGKRLPCRLLKKVAAAPASGAATGGMVVKTSEQVEDALSFLEFAFLSVEGNVRRFELTSLFPPYISAMDNPRLHAADEYFSGQDLGAVFADVGPEAPPQWQSPFRSQLIDLVFSAWQDVMDGNRSPEEVFTEIADTIRDEMEFES